jgi:hypothetical protein
MTKCVTNVMACVAAENSRHFSAPTSRACSITVNNVGPSSTQGPDASFINRWSKKVQIVHAVCRSDGERAMVRKFFDVLTGF